MKKANLGDIFEYNGKLMVFPSAGQWTCPGCGHTTFIQGPITF